jgi:protein DGCR14
MHVHVLLYLTSFFKTLILFLIALLKETPASFETPSTVQRSPGKTETSNEELCEDARTTVRKERQKGDPSDATLDTFLAKHTSEDNASFEQIMEQARLRQKEKYGWLYKKEEEQSVNNQLSLALPEPKQGDQLLQAERPAMIETWTYKNKNALMYCPEGMEESVKDIIDNKTHEKQEVTHRNTRFTRNPFPDNVCSESLASAAAFKSASQLGKIGVDGSEEKASASPQVNGYGFVPATPNLEPGKVDSILY